MAAVNMTNGNPCQTTLFYAVPLILGNFFQLAYNAADARHCRPIYRKRSARGDRNGKSCHEYTDPGISGLYRRRCHYEFILWSRTYPGIEG